MLINLKEQFVIWNSLLPARQVPIALTSLVSRLVCFPKLACCVKITNHYDALKY